MEVMVNVREFVANLRSQTGAATLAQLAAVMFFLVISAVIELIKNCDIGSQCVANSFLWLVILFMAGIWLFALSLLGYAVEMKRRPLPTKILIVGELITAFVAFMTVTHPSGPFTAFAAAITLAISLATAYMAWRVLQARGGRVVTRTRRRPH